MDMEANEEEIENSTEQVEPQEPSAEESELIQVEGSAYKKLQAQLEEYKDKNLRLYADFENARKRLEREKVEFVKYANEGMIVELLEILDNFERVLAAAQQKKNDSEELLKGIEMVIVNIKKLLARHNVKVIEAQGKKFDPHSQEILMQEETDACEDGIVLEEFQKGYTIDGRVVRTAKVKVSKGKNS